MYHTKLYLSIARQNTGASITQIDSETERGDTETKEWSALLAVMVYVFGFHIFLQATPHTLDQSPPHAHFSTVPFSGLQGEALWEEVRVVPHWLVRRQLV